MKRALFFLTALSFAALLNSCGVVDFSNEKAEVPAPTVDISGENVIISIKTLAAYKYVNVIRYEVDDGTNNAGIKADSTFVIGQCVPQNASSALGTILFYDYYTDNTKFYQYYVQYMTPSGHVVSNTSGTVPGAGNGEIQLTPDTAPVRIDYDSEQGLLSLEKARFDPMPETINSVPGTEEYFVLMVAISNGTRTQLFEFSESNLTLNGVPTDLYTINLKARLPESFIGRDLTIEGLVGSHEEKKRGTYTNTDSFYFINYCWTKPVAKTNTELYTKDSDGSSTPKSYFVVENVKDEKQEFDYYIE